MFYDDAQRGLESVSVCLFLCYCRYRFLLGKQKKVTRLQVKTLQITIKTDPRSKYERKLKIINIIPCYINLSLIDY